MIHKNDSPTQNRILIGIPTLGLVRMEWHNAMSGLVVPCNWSNSVQTPIGFLVADAQNIIVHESLKNNFEWTLFIEDDVIVPSDILLKLNKYIESKKYSVVSGLYFLKSETKEPLIYRGRGNGAFKKFKLGEIIEVDGVPTGCLLVHNSILIELAKISEEYELSSNNNKVKLKRVFESPRKVFTDGALTNYHKVIGTSDLYFCDKLIKEDILNKSGWKKLSKKQYPFIVDTSIHCGHIDRSNGIIYA